LSVPLTLVFSPFLKSFLYSEVDDSPSLFSSRAERFLVGVPTLCPRVFLAVSVQDCIHQPPKFVPRDTPTRIATPPAPPPSNPFPLTPLFLRCILSAEWRPLRPQVPCKGQVDTTSDHFFFFFFLNQRGPEPRPPVSWDWPSLSLVFDPKLRDL